MYIGGGVDKEDVVWASLRAQTVENLPAMQAQTWV